LIRRMHIYVDPDFTSSDLDRIRVLQGDGGSPASRPAGKPLGKSKAIMEKQDIDQPITKAGSDQRATEITRQVVGKYFSYMAQGKTPEEISGLFGEEVDWDIPGDVNNVPWIGKRNSRSDIAEFIRTLRELTVPISFEVHKIIANMEDAVALGTLETRVKSTQEIIKTDFAFYFVVKDKLITKFRLLEDSFAVTQAVR
jgi:ketosteroid isomerase-like protein